MGLKQYPAVVYHVAVDSLCGKGFVRFSCPCLYWAVVLSLLICRTPYILRIQGLRLLCVLLCFPYSLACLSNSLGGSFQRTEVLS